MPLLYLSSIIRHIHVQVSRLQEIGENQREETGDDYRPACGGCHVSFVPHGKRRVVIVTVMGL